MKTETQAVRLANMMQKRPLYPEYELALPWVQIKKSALKKLSKGDVLLFGLDSLKMILVDDKKSIAGVQLDATHQNSVEIIYVNEEMQQQVSEKKYKILKCSFGFVQSRKLEIGHRMSISSLNLKEVALFVEGVCIAKGSLVNVDEEIAIEITKVN
ncbi:MAG: hypothetical protein LT067_05110 [Sulfurovum sp.]|nr:hypothetical protein [Sulfurovum sp.]